MTLYILFVREKMARLKLVEIYAPLPDIPTSDHKYFRNWSNRLTKKTNESVKCDWKIASRTYRWGLSQTLIVRVRSGGANEDPPSTLSYIACHLLAEKQHTPEPLSPLSPFSLGEPIRLGTVLCILLILIIVSYFYLLLFSRWRIIVLIFTKHNA